MPRPAANETAPADEIQQAKVTRETGNVEIARYRRVHDSDDIAEAWRLDRLKPITRDLRLLKEGDEVKEGQLLSLIDPSQALDEFDIKKTKLWAARADFAASCSACFLDQPAARNAPPPGSLTSTSKRFLCGGPSSLTTA